jgi:riboflavin biosynthesis pyrimidine reductase
MSDLLPLEILFEQEQGAELPLSGVLKQLYGTLNFPEHPDRPYVIGNFVSTLDGATVLNVPGSDGGGNISGSKKEDRAVMGLLRASADAVIVGAGTLRSEPRHRWTAEYIYPPFASEYQALRHALGKPAYPLNVIVSVQGKINLDLQLFHTGKIPVLIITTATGEQQLFRQNNQDIPPLVQITALPETKMLSAHDIIQVVKTTSQGNLFLVEGGPHLMDSFIGGNYLDELFLTLAPQVAGRDESHSRSGFVQGTLFAPDHPRWGKLISIRRSGSHLFLRYAFNDSYAE